MPNMLWIVPMRRAVIRRNVSYEDAMTAWTSSLDAAKLAHWYHPLLRASLPVYSDGRTVGTVTQSPAPASMTVESLRVRIAAETTNLIVELNQMFRRPSAVTRIEGNVQPGPNVVRATDRIRARLWKGPYRCLVDLDLLAQNPSRSDYDDDLLFDENRCVRKLDAQFHPGDVIEFPIFVLLKRAGITLMNGVEFNPQGSFLNGTSVRKRPSGAVRLHDNQMAMRFQSILSAGLCSWYANAPVFKVGSRLDASCFNAHVNGMHIRARGLVYNGTLSNPLTGSDHLFSVVNMNHFRGGVLPSQPSILGFPPNGRYTWGWSCNPCQLMLAYLMTAKTDSWGGGGTPMRQAASMANERQPMVHYTTTLWAANRPLYFANVRETENTVEPPSRGRRRRIAELAASGDDFETNVQGQATPIERHRRVLSQSIGQYVDVAADADVQTIRGWYERAQRAVLERIAGGVSWLPPSASEQRRAYRDANGGSERGFDFDDAVAEKFVDRETLLRTLSKSLTPVVLNGHCYTYVRIFPQSKLNEEPSLRTPLELPLDHDPRDAHFVHRDTPLTGPPVSSYLAAYNPLTGEPFTTEADGDVFLFEASGSLTMVSLSGADIPRAVFGSKNFVWKRMYGIHLRATSTANGGWKVEIAEQLTPLSATPPPNPGARPVRGQGEPWRAYNPRLRAYQAAARAYRQSQPTYRSKELVCFSAFDDDKLKMKHGIPRGYEPLALSRTGTIGEGGSPEPREAHVAVANQMHANRAVPFEALIEHELFENVAKRYQKVSTMVGYVRAAKTALTPLSARDARAAEALRALVGRGGGGG